jgi:hypothetical protein
MVKRITEYEAAGEKTQVVIDYCARNRVVPRKSDDTALPTGWTGVSTETIQEGIKIAFGIDIATGTATYTWQRLGADYDVDAAVGFLRDRREELLDAGIDQLAAWK